MLNEEDLNAMRQTAETALPDELTLWRRDWTVTPEGGREATWVAAGSSPARLLPGEPRQRDREDRQADVNVMAARVVVPFDFELLPSDRVRVGDQDFEVIEAVAPRVWALNRVYGLRRTEELLS